MIDYNFQTSKEIMAVWQKGSGLYFVVRFIEVSPPPPPLKSVQGVDEAVAGKQGTVGARVFKNIPTFFGPLGPEVQVARKTTNRASALLFCVVCDVCPCAAKNRDQVKKPAVSVVSCQGRMNTKSFVVTF
jgi:hypothetical protein